MCYTNNLLNKGLNQLTSCKELYLGGAALLHGGKGHKKFFVKSDSVELLLHERRIVSHRMERAHVSSGCN